MKLNNFYGLVIIVLVVVLLDPMGDFAACFAEQMNESNRPTGAAASAAEAAVAAERYQLEEAQVLSPGNINKGKDMDFSQIDKLIKDDPYDDKYYLQKAAMSIAAGKDDAEVRRLTGQGYDAKKQLGEIGADEQYEAHYIIALAQVQSSSNPESQHWKRTHSELCAQVALYKAKFNPTMPVPMGNVSVSAVAMNEIEKYRC